MQRLGRFIHDFSLRSLRLCVRRVFLKGGCPEPAIDRGCMSQPMAPYGRPITPDYVSPITPDRTASLILGFQQRPCNMCRPTPADWPPAAPRPEFDVR